MEFQKNTRRLIRKPLGERGQFANKYAMDSDAQIQISYKGKVVKLPIELIEKMHIKSRKGGFQALDAVLDNRYSLQIVQTDGKEITLKLSATDRQRFIDMISHVRNRGQFLA